MILKGKIHMSAFKDWALSYSRYILDIYDQINYIYQKWHVGTQ